jgi:hypothetical protein
MTKLADSVAQKPFVFIGGLHRSGTSLIHECLRDHPDISGFSGTGVNEDEGQLLQSVYKPASVFGGPGKFGFNPRSFMDETHELVVTSAAEDCSTNGASIGMFNGEFSLKNRHQIW